MKKVMITLIRGYAGKPEKQRRILRSLGLRKRHQSVIKEYNSSISGMIDKTRHLIEVKEIDA